MASDELKGKKVLIIATDGFEDTELLFPKIVLEAKGAEVTITGKCLDPALLGKIKGKVGYLVKIDKEMAEINAEEFDALVIPGGAAPDRLRTMDEAVRITKEFCDAGKVVGAICHGPQLLIEADAVRGRTLSSWKAVTTDLRNAGAEWVDSECHIDGNFITARYPADMSAWSEALVDALAKVPVSS